MMTRSSESILAELRQTPLLTPEQMSRVERAARKSAPGPERIVKRLVDKGWLTPFQAEIVLGGRAGGLVFGHYILLARLGEGGMGAVFKARHVRLGRIDALKVIRADKIASKLVAKRFLREIHLTADLNHPHIIKALDAGEVGKQLYLATEYIPGEDLTATVRRDGPFSVADACLVIYQTALALKHIHERGLIHRDLKPSNIMREEKTRTVKVLDLGLSGSLHELPDAGSMTGNLTRDGVMLGTPDFMAPEQARDPHGVDIRADLYGLGCTFFYILSARTPYEGSAVEKLMQHASSPPPPLILPRSPTPPALAAIVAKLMAKRPEDRYQTPQELIDALLALRPGSPTAAIAPGGSADDQSSPSVDEWQSQFDILIAQDPSTSGSSPIPQEHTAGSRGRRLPVWSIAAIVAMAAIALAIYAMSRKPTTGADAPTPGTSWPEDEPADEFKALRKAVAGTGENRDVLRRRVLEFRAKHAGSPPAAAAAGLLRRLPSPLDRLAPVKGSIADAPIVRLAPRMGSVTGMSFSPTDERLLILRSGQPPEEWDLATLKATGRLQSLAVADEVVLSATPDGRTIVAIDPAGKLAVGSDAKTRTLDVGPGLVATVAAAAPDGKSAVVAFAETETQVARVNLETGKIVGRFDHPAEGVVALRVSPDGTSCLAIGPENLIRLLSLSSGKLLQAFDRPLAVTATPEGVFGPDGHRLYLVGAFRTAGRFTTGSANPDVNYEVALSKPKPANPRWRSPPDPNGIAVSADESAVAVGTQSGKLYVYAAASGKSTQEFQFHLSIRAVAFSTHGRVLAVALEDGSVLLLPLKS